MKTLSIGLMSVWYLRDGTDGCMHWVGVWTFWVDGLVGWLFGWMTR